MSNQFQFLFHQVFRFVESDKLDAAELLLKQILKKTSKNSEAYRYLAIIATKRGDHDTALDLIKKSISADKKNGVAYSNMGNIQQSLGLFSEAIASYLKAIEYNPGYAEAYNNLGNAYQELNELIKAVESYKKAISIDSKNPEFFCNLGNAQWKLNRLGDARSCYKESILLLPGHVNSHLNLSHLDLLDFNFSEGWGRYESRWFTKNSDKPFHIKTSKPRWDGRQKEGRLFIWAEQGIGDQILYLSMLRDLECYPQTKIVSVDKKLLPIFQRSFTSMKFIDKDIELSEVDYDEQIPMGSLGQFLRADISMFSRSIEPYLYSGNINSAGIKENLIKTGTILCGISWKSGRAKFGKSKSIPLNELSPILNLKNVEFVSLQYGEVDAEIFEIADTLKIDIKKLDELDPFERVDDLLSVIELCDIVVTTSNSTAHLAGALGKETLLMLPLGNGKFWYWHDVDGSSLWYPSIKIFKQETLGDWSAPIEKVKIYLEKRFAT